MLLVTQNKKKILCFLNSSHSFLPSLSSKKSGKNMALNFLFYNMAILFFCTWFSYYAADLWSVICDTISCCYCLGILFQQIVMKTYPAKNKTHHRSLLPERLQSWTEVNFAGIDLPLTTRMASAAANFVSRFRTACQVLLAELSQEGQKHTRPRLYLNAWRTKKNKHVPIKQISQRQLKHFSKPWITQGIRASIK